MRHIALFTLAATVIAGTAWSFRGTSEPALAAAESAQAFVQTLDAETKTIAVLSYNSAERPAWHFIPKDHRKGLPIRDMSDEQKAATKELLQAILSDIGYQKVNGARMLEGIVRDLEGEGRRWTRDPNEYHLTLFGDPSEDDKWAVSFEGHHVSMNFAFDGDRIVATTPQFLGSHPATIMAGQERSGAEKGFQLLGDEAELAFELAGSLTDSQRSIAMTSPKAPREIRGAGEAQPPYGDPAGLPGREMTAFQQELLSELIDRYAEVAAAPIHRQRLIDIQGLDDVYFSYAGTMKTGEPHGYTVQGKTFVIEYVNSQPDADGNPANHAHAIWRDLRGDFGVSK